LVSPCLASTWVGKPAQCSAGSPDRRPSVGHGTTPDPCPESSGANRASTGCASRPAGPILQPRVRLEPALGSSRHPKAAARSRCLAVQQPLHSQSRPQAAHGAGSLARRGSRTATCFDGGPCSHLPAAPVVAAGGCQSCTPGLPHSQTHVTTSSAAHAWPQHLRSPTESAAAPQLFLIEPKQPVLGQPCASTSSPPHLCLGNLVLGQHASTTGSSRRAGRQAANRVPTSSGCSTGRSPGGAERPPPLVISTFAAPILRLFHLPSLRALLPWCPRCSAWATIYAARRGIA